MFLEIIILICIIIIIIIIARKLPNVVKFNMTDISLPSKNKYNLLKEADNYFDNKNYKKAEEIYLQLAIKEPRNAKIYNRLGVIYSELKDFSDAKEAFGQAIKLNPKNTSGYFNLAMAEIELREYRNAVETLEKTVKIDKKNKKYRNLLAETRKKIKTKPEESEE